MIAKVLVTGADQHQGLAVVRGLGLAGIPLVAGSPRQWNMGFASRYAKEKAIYTSPMVDPALFVGDVITIVRRHDVGMIIPAVESTLVALDGQREVIEELCPIAAPPSQVLAWAIDKSRTLELAQRVGVPVPRTVVADNVDEALVAVRDFSFPVAIKPRGNALHVATRHRQEFKVKYACSREELRAILEIFRHAGTLPLVQEYAGGVGICVSALFDHNRVVAIMPYVRLREVPLTGGVSVLRETIPLDERLRNYTIAMLGALRWRGMAMVEFKYDAVADRYILMEINGRFQASTALSLDAGINFPELTYRLFMGEVPTRYSPIYRCGIRERWLRGDIQALTHHLGGTTLAEAVPQARHTLPSKRRALWTFLRDFRPGIHFDEFKRYDPLPGVVEAFSCSMLLLRSAYGGVCRLFSRFNWRRAKAKAPALSTPPLEPEK